MSLSTFQMTNYKSTRSIYPGDDAKLAKDSKNLKELGRNYHVLIALCKNLTEHSQFLVNTKIQANALENML